MFRFVRTNTDNCCRLIQFVITKALPYIFASFGYGTWFFFAVWMLIATVWAFFFLPETKGKTLDEFDVILYVSLDSLITLNESREGHWLTVGSGYVADRSRVASDVHSDKAGDKEDVIEHSEEKLA